MYISKLEEENSSLTQHTYSASNTNRKVDSRVSEINEFMDDMLSNPETRQKFIEKLTDSQIEGYDTNSHVKNTPN